MKTCSTCGNMRELTSFSYRNKAEGTRHSRCKSCFSKQDNKYRSRLNGMRGRSFEVSSRSFLLSTYGVMKQRVMTHPRYKGLELCTKKEFITWAEKDLDFNWLFVQYKNSKGVRALAPSVDRIDSSKGYTLDNMRFLTLSENGRLGANSRWCTQTNQEGK